MLRTTHKLDLIGQKYGRWTVEKRSHKNARGEWYWQCRCECGTVRNVLAHSLQIGCSSSCGCTKNRKHGMEATPIYNAWAAMIQRCENPNSKTYPDYGGRGISVCERWHSFVNFHADMGNKPVGLSLDRIDNNGNYEPSNCRWTSSLTQMRNRRTTRLLTIDGKTKPASEWAEMYGINRRIVADRLNRGWDALRALTTKNRKG